MIATTIIKAVKVLLPIQCMLNKDLLEISGNLSLKAKKAKFR